MPAARPLTDWLPLAAVLLRPEPEMATEVALAVDQLTVAAPGSLRLVGVMEMEPVTGGMAVKFAVTLQSLWMLESVLPERLAGPVNPVNCQPDAALAVKFEDSCARIPLGGLADAEHPAAAAAAGETITKTE